MTSPDRNPIPSTNDIPSPLERKGLPTQPLWVLSILCVLSSALLGCGLAWSTGVFDLSAPVAQTIGAAVLLILLFYVFRILRTVRWMPFLILLLSSLLCYVTGSFDIAAMWLALLCAIGFFALLLAVADKPVLTRLAFIPLAAYGIALAVSRDPLLSLASLVPFPAAAALAFGTRASAAREDGPGRVGVLCMTSLCLGVATLGMSALLLNRHLGTLSPTHLNTWLDGIRTSLSSQLAEISKLLADQIPQMSTISEAQALDIVNSAINVFPGCAVVLCNLCAALAQVILQGSLCAFSYGDSVKGRVRLFRMSLVSSVVFLIAGIFSLIMLLASSDSSLAETVAENIVIILHPGLALAGILRFLYSITRRGRGGCMPLIILLLIPCVLVYASLLPAVYEAIASILNAVFSHMSRPHDDDDSGNDQWENGSGSSSGN